MYTILHVEQSMFFCKILEELLSKDGYQYLATDSFNDASKILEEQDIDLIVTSLYGKGGKLEDFIREINDGDKNDVPIFVVTSNNMDDKKKELINLGICDYILKEDLKEELTKHLYAVLQEDEYIKNLKEAKIAVVEDSSLESLVEEQMFNKYDIKNVDYYKSGTELLKSGKKYDVYLIDIILKNEFGKDVIRQVRRNNINSSIIAVTSLNNPKTLASILNSGADDIINKPIDDRLFIAKLKSNIRIYTLNKKVKNILKEMKGIKK